MKGIRIDDSNGELFIKSGDLETYRNKDEETLSIVFFRLNSIDSRETSFASFSPVSLIGKNMSVENIERIIDSSVRRILTFDSLLSEQTAVASIKDETTNSITVAIKTNLPNIKNIVKELKYRD